MNSRRIPSLDGLRAVAVLLVLLGHISLTAGYPQALHSTLMDNAAHLGVSIFFVLSGFLITSLLVEECDRMGRISLRSFYVRRTLRIFPAAYLYMTIIGLLAAIGIVELRVGDLFHAATYTMNYHHDRAWTLGHLWSLGVEEQFYLLWPLAFTLLGQRRALWLAAGAIAAAPILRVVSWVYFPGTRDGLDEEFQVVCDGLATGCVLALLVHRFGREELARKIPRLIYAIAPIVAVISSALAQWPSFTLSVGVTITNLAIALMVLWCVARADTAIGRALNSRPAIFLGVISYSLYLWQQLFMDRTRTSVIFSFPVNVILALAAAVASYYLVERPFQALRERFRR